MGNCVVLKPAETTSITAIKLAEIIQDAGLPPGVVNFVRAGAGGDRRRAGWRNRSRRRWRSPARPKSAKSSCAWLAGSDKKMTMELGGNAANIVFDDPPIDQAVEGIIAIRN